MQIGAEGVESIELSFAFLPSCDGLKFGGSAKNSLSDTYVNNRFGMAKLPPYRNGLRAKAKS
jgi:hypothetical protein